MKYLNELRDRDAVSLDLVVVGKSPPTSTKGASLMVVIDVADKTRTIRARYFADAEKCTKFFNGITLNKAYHISGEYSEQFNSITINKPELALVTDPDWSRLRKEKTVNPEQIRKLDDYIMGIKTPEIKSLLEKLFARPKLKTMFATWPAASSYHHAKPNGLITHVLEMLDMAENLAKIYPRMNRDLLYLGCIIHDLGKIIELDPEFATVYSDKGKLLTHIPLGFLIIGEILEKEIGCEADLSNRILHMILSHHGNPANGVPSIVAPKTLEAVALHQIDLMSSQISPIHESDQFGQGWVSVNRNSYYLSDSTEQD